MPLGKSRSKDQIQIKNNLREKYLNIGGAQNILKEGRKESQRLLMDRYKRDDASQQRGLKPSYHNLDMYMMK